MVKSRSEDFLTRKGEARPAASQTMVKAVSQHRREQLESEIDSGVFSKGYDDTKDSVKKIGANPTENTPLGNVVTSSLTKSAQSFVGSFTENQGGGSVGNGYRGPGGDVRQAPEVYSPLWLNSNLNLPRDRATINAWSRSFFVLNPIVQNAISLHSTYPISKLNIKCKNPRVNAFFENMIDEIDLMNICVQLAQEYWTLGEAFVYAELDEGSAKWSRLLIQNPDYMVVRRSVIAGEPVISMRPDENLRRIVTSNRNDDLLQRQQLDPSIIEHVRRGENIPLSNFYVSHIARKSSPYEIRGTGLPVSCFRQLMLWDKLRECYSFDTEVLTKDGFKTISEITEFSQNIEMNPNYVNGIQLDENKQITGIYKLKDNIEVACFNQETDEIEYHKPIEFHISQYNGEMVHFSGKKIDCLVSPNHKMLTAKKVGKNYNDFELIRASEFSDTSLYKFKNIIQWKGLKKDTIEILNNFVDTKLFLKLMGYILSEGCVDNSINKKTGYQRNRIAISQHTNSDCYHEIKSCMKSFATNCGLHLQETLKVYGNGFSKHCPKEQWIGTISNKELVSYLVNEIGDGNSCHSKNKKIPRWVLELDKDYLIILLDSMMGGDGTVTKIKKGISYRYCTASKQLADDVQEIAFKCGYSPFISVSQRKTCIEYTIRWSDNNQGKKPIVYNNAEKCGSFKKVQYTGQVWCFEVPTGCFITRRNNRIAIHGNSKFAQADNMINPLTLITIGGGQDNYKPTPADLEFWRQAFEATQYDKDAKLFTHDGVKVEKVGSGQGIYDIGPDITQLIKEIYIGLMVPQVIMDGGADVTYANGGVALDVLRQRYMQFRNMISSWLRRKIFAPISKINDFYDYKDKEKVLIVPEVEWNHMSLFDMGDYIQNISQLISQEPRKVSLQTLYRSLGLEYEDEVRKIRRESIDQVIQVKEMEALQRMNLNDLRSIGEEDEIEEVQESPLPGESPYSQPGAGAGGGLGEGLGGGLGGGLSGGLGGSPLGGGMSMPPLGGGGPPSGGPLPGETGGGGAGGAPPPPPAV